MFKRKLEKTHLPTFFTTLCVYNLYDVVCVICSKKNSCAHLVMLVITTVEVSTDQFPQSYSESILEQRAVETIT